MAFRQLIDLVRDGEKVEAAVANRPLGQLLENDNYLKGVLDVVANGAAIFARSATFDSTVLVGQPVYYNSLTAKFEKAQAITGKEDCVGICYSKSSSVAGDILLAGRAAVSLSNAFTGTVTAGRYFLSTTEAGKVVNVRPSTLQISVLIADGAGNVTVFPHENRSIPGTQGIQGIQGLQGTAGAAGATGATGPASYLYKNKSGTSFHLAGQMTGGPLFTTTPTINVLYAIPFYTAQGGTVDRLMIDVSSAGLAGSDARVGIYDSIDVNTGNLYPKNRLAPDFGSINCSSAGTKTVTPPSSIVIPANTVVWVVFTCGVAAPGVRALSVNSCHPLLGADATFQAPGVGYSVVQTYGILPTTFPEGATVIRTGEIPAVALRFVGTAEATHGTSVYIAV